MRMITTNRALLIEPCRLLPPARPTSFGLLVPASAVEPHPNVGRLYSINEHLREQGLEIGDLVLFDRDKTVFEVPWSGFALLYVITSLVQGKVELEPGWTVIAARDPLPQELAPAFAPQPAHVEQEEPARAACLTQEVCMARDGDGGEVAVSLLKQDGETVASVAPMRLTDRYRLGDEPTIPEAPPHLEPTRRLKMLPSDSSEE